MSNYLSNRQKSLRVGIESYTENTTSLSVIGKVGIGTTNATTNLDVAGGVKIRGGILDSSNSSGTNSYVVTADGSGGWSWQPVNAGVATYVDNAGYASTAGIATYAATAGIATYAATAGIVTNIKGGNVGDIPYQSATNTTTFLNASTASSGQVLLYNGSIPIWGNVSAASGAFGGISIQDEGTPVGTANSITTINFVGSSVVVTATSGANGIATVSILSGYASTAGIATYASTAGIATYASTAGIATYASTAGIATNLKGGAGGQIVYQSALDTTAFLVNGTSGYILQSNGGTNAPSWVPAPPANAITGLTIRDEGTIVGGANSVSQLNFVGDIVSVASTLGIATITFLNYVSNSGLSTSVIGGIASVTQLSVSGLSTFSGIATHTALIFGTQASFSGVVTASSFSGNATSANYSTSSGISTYSSTSGIATNVIGGIASVTQLSVSGVSTIGNFRITPVGSGATVGQAGIVTYYGDGSQLSGISAGSAVIDGFNTGITSSVQILPLSYETTVFTFPSTAGKQYVIESINVANVDTSVGVGTTVNIIASIQDSTAEQTYIAYNVPVTNGGLIELLKNPIVAGPSDVIKMWVTNDAYTGVNNAAEVYMNYSEYTSTEYISEYASTVSIATTDPTAVYTSSTYPSTIESIHFANRTDTGDYPVSVSITNGLTTTYLAKNLIIPRYSTVDILDRPKRVETNGVIKVEVAQTSTIDVIIAGKQITS